MSTTPQDCLDADTLTAFSRGQLSQEARARVLEHALQCADCADLLALSSDLREWSDAAAASVVPVARPRPLRLPAWAALAATLVLAIGIVRTVWQTPGPVPVLRGHAIVALAPLDRAVLSAAPTRLAWDCAAPAPVRVQLLHADGSLLQQWESDRCELDLAASPLVLGTGTYLWAVTDMNGQRIAGPYGFSVDVR